MSRARVLLGAATCAIALLAATRANAEPLNAREKATSGDAPLSNAEESTSSSVDPTPSDVPACPTATRRALGAAAAIVPGVVVHGSGHLVAGDTQTGLRLLALEGAGIGVLATGFVPIVLTGASRRLVGPAAALSVVGVGLFAISLLSDVYGVVAPAGGFGAPATSTPELETAMGYRYVYNPVFAYRQFVVQEVDYRTGRWRFHPSAWFALDDTNTRLRAHSAYRFTGPLPRAISTARDGSFLDVEAALTRHAYTSDRFTTTTAEMSLAGRLDMGRIGPSLRGSFAEMSVGLAFQAYSYDTRRASPDFGELLLARFAYGLYLGRRGQPRGELKLYYDHRHDDFAAGLKMRGLGSGVIGHFGAGAHLYVSDHFGLGAQAAIGSAFVTGVSVLFRHGDPL